MDTKVRIKQLMDERNISEYRLAKNSGLSQSTISNIFVRNTSPTIPTVEAICNGLGITLSQFFCDESQEQSVYLTPEQKQMFDSWVSLSEEQKQAITTLIQSFSK
ncbi:MAG: helix-turn-helix transcriptional regulator [Clostridia bacterium]|nr:helix-turn-helix transcriptional regulator [Clostridia bacterium]